MADSKTPGASILALLLITLGSVSAPAAVAHGTPIGADLVLREIEVRDALGQPAAAYACLDTNSDNVCGSAVSEWGDDFCDDWSGEKPLGYKGHLIVLVYAVPARDCANALGSIAGEVVVRLRAAGGGLVTLTCRYVKGVVFSNEADPTSAFAGTQLMSSGSPDEAQVSGCTWAFPGDEGGGGSSGVSTNVVQAVVEGASSLLSVVPDLINIEGTTNGKVVEGGAYTVGWLLSTGSPLPVTLSLGNVEVSNPGICGNGINPSVDSVDDGMAPQPEKATYKLYREVYLNITTPAGWSNISTGNKISVQLAGAGGALPSGSRTPFDCTLKLPYIAQNGIQTVQDVLTLIVQVFPLPAVKVPIGSFTVTENPEAVAATPSSSTAADIIVNGLNETFNITASVTTAYNGPTDGTSDHDYATLSWSNDVTGLVRKYGHGASEVAAESPPVTLSNGQRTVVCAKVVFYDKDDWKAFWNQDDAQAENSICASFKYVKTSTGALGIVGEGCEQAAGALFGGNRPSVDEAVGCALNPL